MMVAAKMNVREFDNVAGKLHGKRGIAISAAWRYIIIFRSRYLFLE